MSETILYNTKSLSVADCQEIDACVVLEDGKVYLEKSDIDGKKYRTLIEKDYDYYCEASAKRPSRQAQPVFFHIYVTSKCNLNCKVCYESNDNLKEPALSELKELFKGRKNQIISISGREPTCRQDLPEIVRIICKRNKASLLTNGLKLADYDYCLLLKKNGLKNVTFSFNGFDDEIYRRMNGKPLLEQKLKALKNLKKAGLSIFLNVTIARGVNDDQIKKLCDFCFENRDSIFELRVRSLTPMGKHLEIEPYCMSEFLELIASSIGVKKTDLLKEYNFLKEVLKELNWLTFSRMRIFWSARVCSFTLHLKKERNTIRSVAEAIDMERIKKAKFKKVLFLYYLLKMYGVRYILETSFFIKLPSFLKNKNILKVGLRCWPSIYNIDLKENLKCPTQFYKNGKWHSFCYHNIIESSKS